MSFVQFFAMLSWAAKFLLVAIVLPVALVYDVSHWLAEQLGLPALWCERVARAMVLLFALPFITGWVTQCYKRSHSASIPEIFLEPHLLRVLESFVKLCQVLIVVNFQLLDFVQALVQLVIVFRRTTIVLVAIFGCCAAFEAFG